MFLKLNQVVNRCLGLAILKSLVSFEKTCSIEKWEVELECKELGSLSSREVDTVNTNAHTQLLQT